MPPVVVLQQERQRPQSVLAMTLPDTATAHNWRIGLALSRLWAERFNIHLRRWHMHLRVVEIALGLSYGFLTPKRVRQFYLPYYCIQESEKIRLSWPLMAA